LEWKKEQMCSADYWAEEKMFPAQNSPQNTGELVIGDYFSSGS